MLENYKRSINKFSLPAFLYGTAWKEEDTQALTLKALQNGFEGIDTANQRKHYFEEGVGLGIQEFLKSSGKKRSDLFLQTKFTSSSGQDHRKPYSDLDSTSLQVRKSFESSLEHLQTDYIDSYILHGPSLSSELIQTDFDIWAAMEDLFHEEKIRFLGISNVNLSQLETLYTSAKVKPVFVQNRCFANTQWDQSIRLFCKHHGIIYQGFSLLTANVQHITAPAIQAIAKRHQKTIPQIIFRFALQVEILPLTGTTNSTHMQQDLALDFELSAEELMLIMRLPS